MLRDDQAFPRLLRARLLLLLLLLQAGFRLSLAAPSAHFAVANTLFH
jgi:hypothetical protein